MWIALLLSLLSLLPAAAAAAAEPLDPCASSATQVAQWRARRPQDEAARDRLRQRVAELRAGGGAALAAEEENLRVAEGYLSELPKAEQRLTACRAQVEERVARAPQEAAAPAAAPAAEPAAPPAPPPAPPREQLAAAGSEDPALDKKCGADRACLQAEIARVEASCDAGALAGCRQLGRAYVRGIGVPQDAARGAGLFRKACDGGHAPACSSLGQLHLEALGVEQADATAATLFWRGCQGGHAGGCANLAYLYGEGRGVLADGAKMRELAQRACDGGSLNGCNILGVAYVHGEGGAADRARALELFKRACAGGIEKGCSNLARNTAAPPRPEPSAPRRGRASAAVPRGAAGRDVAVTEEIRGGQLSAFEMQMACQRTIKQRLAKPDFGGWLSEAPKLESLPGGKQRMIGKVNPEGTALAGIKLTYVCTYDPKMDAMSVKLK